mgnify:CR=1 FL=1
MKRGTFVFFLVILLSSIVSPVLGSVGVGVGTGKISLDQALRPGISYNLPPITVYNTGDKASSYYVSIEFSTREGKLESSREWYVFTPEEFYLEPGGSQVVEVKLKIPMRGAKPGDYFAFLTAQPKDSLEEGSASVGVAAAVKLYFTVVSANIFQATFYVLSDLFLRYKPWSIIIPLVILLFIIWKLLKKRFKIQVIKQ